MSGASLVDATPPAPPQRPEPQRRERAATAGSLARVAAVGLGIFMLAAAIRLFAIDAYVTIDESRWVQRASDFSALIDQHNDEDTFIIGHPGVTTMWTALIGLGTERAHRFSFLEGRTDATRRDGYYEALIAARRPFAIVGALGVAAVALLGWRLLGAGAGILGGLLLACEPFLVAHARVAHLDSGLTAYAAVAALSGLVFWTAGGAWPYLVLSGLATGLAFLTKAPSVFVIGFVPLAAGLAWLFWDRRPRSVLRVVAQFVAWGAVAAAVAWAVWPVMRVDAIGTVLKMAQFTERVGGGEHDNFFVGTVTDDPGLLFYPLALLLRLAPMTLLGTILAAALWRRLNRTQRRTAGFLALYGVGFMAMMTIGPKKFDRYLLPIFPMFGLLAGLGLWTAARLVQPSRRAPWLRLRSAGDTLPGAPSLTRGALAVLVLAVVVQAATLLPVIRYPLAYYNPLLGGGALASRMVLIGWGEGLDQVGAWIGEQPRPLGEPTVATSYHRVLQAQLTGSAVPLEHVRMADYVVPYINTLQRHADLDVLGPFLREATPVHVVSIAGIEYARVYRGPHHPVTTEHGADLSGQTTLVRSVIAPGSGSLRPGEDLTVGLRWSRTIAARVVVAMVGPNGRIVAQADRPLGDDGPDAQGQPGEIHRLTVPERTPPDTYRLVLRVLDGQSRAPLAVTDSRSGTDPTQLLLRELQVETAP